MPPQKKIALQYIGAILTLVGMAVAGISAAAITGEKVRQQGQQIMEIKANWAAECKAAAEIREDNTDEHKMILQKLSRIEAILSERGRP